MALQLVLATANPAKRQKLLALSEGLASVVVPSGDQPHVEEAALTHLGNAIAKAVAWSRAYGAGALASDGGLSIPALGAGWLSTLTHRQTGEQVSDEVRAKRLLVRMRELRGVNREAHWTEAIAYARHGRLVAAWEAYGASGTIGESFRANTSGPSGFWADGLWETPDGRRRWELSPEELASVLDPWSQLTMPVRDFLRRLA